MNVIKVLWGDDWDPLFIDSYQCLQKNGRKVDGQDRNISGEC